MRNIVAIAVTLMLCTACGSEQESAMLEQDWFVAYQSSRMASADTASSGLEDDAPTTTKGPF